jgi:hypothetical protein
MTGLILCGLLAAARADTFKLANGDTLTGELLTGTAGDTGVQIKVADGKYEKVPWANFSQEDIKKFSENPKLQAFVEPFVEITPEERIQKTQVNIKPPPRLDRPMARSLAGAMLSSGLGFFLLLVLYAANIYAGYEISIFRGQPTGLVCGVAAIAPLIGPIIFFAIPTRLKPGEKADQDAEAPGEPVASAAAGAVAAAPANEINPMRAEGAAHPSALKLAHADSDMHSASAKPAATTFQRGQFTFNRRFFETKFPGFFGAVRHGADRDMVLVIKSARGQYTGQRITRIAANDLHLLVQHGPASEEILIPFQEVQEVQLKPREA